MKVGQNKKSILITGCSSGIGLHTATTLKSRGYRVFASCRQQQDVERLRAEGFEHVVCLDLDYTQSIREAVNVVLDLCQGDLYAVFNNSGFGQPGAVEDVSRTALREQFETNVFGPHELVQLLLPTLLKQPSARIIQHSSVLGFVGMPYRGAYNASKYALEGLSDTLRLELRGTPVKVSLIEPGPILSQFRANALKKIEKHIDIENSRHRLQYEKALARLSADGPAVPFTLGPEAVTAQVIRALESRSPKARYRVTAPTVMLAYLKRVLPTSLFDRVVLACS